MTVDVDASLARRCQVMRAALEEIERALPAISAGSEAVWENRQWAGQYRELQLIARKALATAKGVA